MRANRKRVKEWLRKMDKEDYQRLLDTALFTSDEKEYIHMHCIEGMTFQQIYIDKGMSKKQYVSYCRAHSKQDRTGNRKDGKIIFKKY